MAEKYSKNKDYKVIAVVVGWFSQKGSLDYLREISNTCAAHQCKAVFFSTLTDLYYGNKNDQCEQQIFDLIDVKRFDAIWILSERFKGKNLFGKLIERAHQADVPVVSLDRELPGCISIVFDYKAAFREVMNHMIEHHGYRKINFMNGRRNDVYSDERLEAYREALEEHGIPYEPERVYYGEFWENPTIQEMDRMMKEWPQLPDAIVCANDAMALTVNDYLKKKGYRIPADIATSGFDGMDIEEYSNPRLTTAIHDVGELIDRAYEFLAHPEEMNSKKVTYVCHQMQIGCSCGCDGLKPYDVNSEMVRLQSAVYRETEFQNSMNEMVSILAKDDSFVGAMHLIFQRLIPVSYHELWVCSNMIKDELTPIYSMITDMWDKMSNTSDKIYSDKVWVLHNHSGEEETPIDENLIIDKNDLVPDLNAVLEKYGSILFTTMHLSEETVGYMGITCDMDQFWASAYATFITSFRYIIELHMNQMNLLRAYLFDPLTGLYNRLGFFDRINKLWRKCKNCELALISMDMDGLKHINDTYGHAMGDEAIAALGMILGESAQGELATRIGGDEFLVAVIGEHAGERAQQITDRIKEKICSYNEAQKRCYILHASIGVYCDKIKENTLDTFMKKADALMYQDKTHNKHKLYMHPEQS